MQENKIYNYNAMKLNSKNHSDDTFNKSIKFIVEKYIYDDIPQKINCNNLHEAIQEAYKLWLNDELHSIGIEDKNKNYNGTNALNYFGDTYTFSKQQNRIEELEKELELHKVFLNKNNAIGSFNNFKENK